METNLMVTERFNQCGVKRITLTRSNMICDTRRRSFWSITMTLPWSGTNVNGAYVSIILYKLSIDSTFNNHFTKVVMLSGCRVKHSICAISVTISSLKICRSKPSFTAVNHLTLIVSSWHYYLEVAATSSMTLSKFGSQTMTIVTCN